MKIVCLSYIVQFCCLRKIFEQVKYYGIAIAYGIFLFVHHKAFKRYKRMKAKFIGSVMVSCTQYKQTQKQHFHIQIIIDQH